MVQAWPGGRDGRKGNGLKKLGKRLRNTCRREAADGGGEEKSVAGGKSRRTVGHGKMALGNIRSFLGVSRRVRAERPRVSHGMREAGPATGT